MSLVSKVSEAMVSRLDGWINTLTGMGTSRDKVTSGYFGASATLTAPTLAALYRDDDMAARIVEQLVYEAIRPGYSIRIDSEDDAAESIELSSEVVAYLEDSKAFGSLVQAWAWGRLFGGGAVYVIWNDGQEQDQPLNTSVPRDILGFHVFEHQELHAVDFIDDPLDPDFGKPSLFRLTPAGVRHTENTGTLVHRSRLILFEGIPEPRSMTFRTEQFGWGGASVLQRAYEPLRAFQSFWANFTHLTQDASQGVFKLCGLVDAIASGNEDLLAKRLSIVDMSRSTARSIMLDAESEDFNRLPHNLTGWDVAAQQFALRLAAAAQMPVSLLMGQAPAGLNATGEADTRAWYDRVVQVRERDFLPQMNRMLELVFASSNGPTGGAVPDNWSIEYNGLLQMSDLEKAQLRKTVAEMDSIYIGNGVLLESEVALSRFTTDGYSMETTIDLDIRKELLESEQEKALNPPQPPMFPPPVPEDDEESDDENDDVDEAA